MAKSSASEKPNNRLFTLPGEIRNALYEAFLTDDLNAPEYFNQQVRQLQLPVPVLARAYPAYSDDRDKTDPGIHEEVLSYFYGGMWVEIDLRNDGRFWDFWALFTATDPFLAQLRKFKISGPRVCDGISHPVVFINLNNPQNPASCGNQKYEHRIHGCPCKTPYEAAVGAVDIIVKRGYSSGRLVLTTEKLRQIFDVVSSIDAL